LIYFDSCDWNNPGQDRFTGLTAMVVYQHKDIPEDIQDKLYARILNHEYEDAVKIRADGSIKGQGSYERLRDMVFGADKMCSEVRYNKLKEPQSALVYCETKTYSPNHPGLDGAPPVRQTYCFAIPSICGNIARVDPIDYEFREIRQQVTERRIEVPQKTVLRSRAVPEPDSLWLVMMGAVLMTWIRSKVKTK
jgi:hypothetical protein